MLSMFLFLGIFANIAIALTTAFVLSKIVPTLSNKVCRFAVVFLVFVPVNLVINSVNVRTMGYHKMSWTGALIIAAIVAIFGTFWPPKTRATKTR